VVNPEIDGQRRKWLIPKQALMRPAELGSKWPPRAARSAQSGVLPGREALRAFCARLSKRQQRDDVAAKAWRIGPVREGEAAGGAGKIESDLILADRRRRFDVEHRIEAERIREINVACARSCIGCPGSSFLRQQIECGRGNWMLPSAAQAQVGVR